MKHFFVALFFLCTLFLTEVKVCTAGTMQSIEVTQEMLLSMDQNTRNNFLNEIKKLQTPKEKPIVSEDFFTEQSLAKFNKQLDGITTSLVNFFEKLGVKANEFIKTDLGKLTIIGIAYQMGFFSGLWSIFTGSFLTLTCLILIAVINRRRKVTICTYNKEGEVTGKEEVLVATLNPFEDSECQSGFRLVGTLVLMVGAIVGVVRVT
mgnify:CR=1 FL=1